MRVHSYLVGALLVVLSSLLTQASEPSHTSPPQALFNLDAIPRPPVPADPLELAFNTAQPVQDAQQRIAVVAMLQKAHDLSNVRAFPYNLTTSFVATGGSSADGNWMLQDVANGRAYRWGAQGPNYSTVNLYPDSTRNGVYGNVPGGVIPLRLSQVRSAIFFTYPIVGPRASVRMTSGNLDGAEQNCLLISIGAGNRTFSGGRNWEESEYCIDAKTGLLTTYSLVPGMFVQYDYSSGIQFHGKSIPTAFKITEAGRTVVEARTVSVTDPPSAKDALFNAAGLPALGVGRVMNPPTNMRMTLPVPGQRGSTINGNASIQVVVLHGTAAPNGRLSDIEILASTDPDLNQTAVTRAGTMAQQRLSNQPGATEQSQEMVFTMEFVTPNR